MTSVLLFSLVTFLWGLTATPVSIGLAEKFRLLDVPGGRKKHHSIMPRGAGLVLWSGYLLWALFAGNRGVEVPYIATGATVVFMIGYMDDMHSLPPLFRLVFHLAAAVWAASPIPVPLWQRLLFAVWIAGATNAYNMIDGMDGLCLTMTLITSLVSFAACRAAFWLPFAGLVFGVLLWNFPQPRTFLGDGGSTLLGYICSTNIVWNFFPDAFGKNFIHLSIVLILVGGVPVIDTLTAMTRRVLTGKSPFLPDRGHAHHRLLDAGCSKFTTLIILGTAHIFIIALGYYVMGIRILKI